jgi:hypothetical protein
MTPILKLVGITMQETMMKEIVEEQARWKDEMKAQNTVTPMES